MAPRKKAAAKKVTRRQYYTIQFEKYMEIVEEINKTYYILSDKIKELAETVPVERWSEYEIADFFDTFVLIDSYRIFLDEKVNNPSEEEVEFTVKHNIKDVLFNKDELALMQQLFLTVEAKKEFLLNNYGFSSNLN